ncbi:MAG: response regulator [Deltaproteobacteria bacterium]|nr:response regulator [Deltaproteobacteria bacterium]
MTTETQKSILMADDDEEDCFLATEAFMESGGKAAFSCVTDGVKLMEYLSARSAPGPNGLPDLILLDLNMPIKNGREALLEIKSNPFFTSIPVVVLTTSAEKKDIEFSIGAGANLFITKPSAFNDWIEMMRSIVMRWL